MYPLSVGRDANILASSAPTENERYRPYKSLVILTERSEWKDLGTELTAKVTVNAKIPRLAGARSGRHMGYMVRLPQVCQKPLARYGTPRSSCPTETPPGFAPCGAASETDCLTKPWGSPFSQFFCPSLLGRMVRLIRCRLSSTDSTVTLTTSPTFTASLGWRRWRLLTWEMCTSPS